MHSCLNVAPAEDSLHVLRFRAFEQETWHWQMLRPPKPPATLSVPNR